MESPALHSSQAQVLSPAYQPEPFTKKAQKTPGLQPGLTHTRLLIYEHKAAGVKLSWINQGLIQFLLEIMGSWLDYAHSEMQLDKLEKENR